ncbi:MAG: hypothetical protein OXG08_03135 [Gammaproteobacteria bacterium]|nr:hypothetical protein [Gammaproteobacteria bacterium]
MKESGDLPASVVSKASEDSRFRASLLASPKQSIEREFGISLGSDHEIHVHEESDGVTHLVLPPKHRLSDEEREEARTGASSLEFLKKTMHDPAPPLRSPSPRTPTSLGVSADAATSACRSAIRRALEFLSSAVDPSGAWHCIRFNLGNPDIPRHYERPPFVSALCALAIQCSEEPLARELLERTRNYLATTIEHPGFWRYYRHLPQDLDSSSLCSLVVRDHPWILLQRNVPRMLNNCESDGRFTTWLLGEREPDVVAKFRIEADPVVNANVIAYLGDRPATQDARRWLEDMIVNGFEQNASKWYQDPVSTYYAISRAMPHFSPSSSDDLGSLLVKRTLALRDETGEFENVLQAAQAITTLHNLGQLDQLDTISAIDQLLGCQHEDGSFPELLAFGDQSLQWGVVGQIGHGSESVTTAFCVEALERLCENLEQPQDFQS